MKRHYIKYAMASMALVALIAILTVIASKEPVYRTDMGVIYNTTRHESGGIVTEVLCDDGNIYAVYGSRGAVGTRVSITFDTNNTDDITDDIVVSVD